MNHDIKFLDQGHDILSSTLSMAYAITFEP